MSERMKRARFWFDGAEPVEGWTAGETWNGFGVPRFESEDLPAVLRMFEAIGYQTDRMGETGDVLIATDDESFRFAPHCADGRFVWALDGFTWHERPVGAEPDAPISPDDPAIRDLLLRRAGAKRVRYDAPTDEWHVFTTADGWHFAGYGSELADQIATREGL